jgi:hypothetical protein
VPNCWTVAVVACCNFSQYYKQHQIVHPAQAAAAATGNGCPEKAYPQLPETGVVQVLQVWEKGLEMLVALRVVAGLFLG